MLPNIGLFLAKRAQLNADREAIVEVERDRRFTYRELNHRCNRTAAVLDRKSVGKGDRVAILMANGVEYLECFLACAKLGAIVVPLNWRLVTDELELILKDSGSTVLFFDAEFDELTGALTERDIDVRHWVRVGDSASCPAWAADYVSLTGSASTEEPEVTAGADDCLFIMYTSGTTGLPKGVVHSHNTTLWASLTFNMTSDMRLGDRYLQVMPLFHVGALVPATAMMHRGGTLIVMRRFDPDRVFDVIEHERCTIGLMVPAMLQMMWDSARRDHTDHSSVRWILSGAAPVPVSLIEQYASIGIEIHQVYGLTESCGPACVIGSDDATAKAGSAGAAFFHTDVRVVDEDGRDVGVGEVGEVIVRGPHVMVEYWKRPDATADTLRDGWLYTGDLATVDEQRFVYIQDRKKDMIISGGENVYPAEIENVLTNCSLVKECAVIGMRSKKWGEVPAAIVTLHDGSDASADDILAYCADKLARYKIPKVVEFSDDIPRSPTGKILKRALRERYPGPAPE